MFNLLLCSLLWLLGLPALAQTPPDAGAIRRQLEGAASPALPPRAAPLDTAEPAPMTLPDGARVTVRAFRFEGHTLLSDADLAAAVQPWQGRPIGFGELQQATRAVAQAYRAAGWLAHATLPQQDVTDGLVSIRIVEAVYSGVRVGGAPPTRIEVEHVLALVQARAQPGDKLNTRRLDEAMLLADDLPGVVVSGALEPGRQEGETTLVLRVLDEPAASGEVNLDNGGSRSTGSTRLTLQAQLGSPLLRGDQLRGQVAASEGSRYVRLAYNFPVGSLGTRLGANLSALNYRLVDGDFAALGGRGRSESVGLDLRHPLLHSRQQNLYLAANADAKRYSNQAAQATQSRYSAKSLSLGLDGNRYDDLGGGGATTAALHLHRGHVDLGVLDSGENTTVAGRYSKLRFAATRLQSLGPRLSLLAQLRGQVASRQLDSSERLFLGGPDGVRAYPNNEGSGSSGHVASAELRWQMNGAWMASAFADEGRVRDPGVAGSAYRGAGAALAWAGPQGLAARAVVAQRIGHNPRPAANGADQDGTRDKTRVWLQLTKTF
jgi:hemolysin activation/secretion protein